MNKRECEDAISRQSVNELFDSEIKMYEERIETRKGSNYHDETERIKEFRSRVANAEYWQDKIRALPPVKSTQGWIPVTEDVPPIGTICLWCNKQGSVFTSEITYRSECNSYVGKHGYFSNGLQNYGDIVAWMPLPPSYQGEENG